MVPPFEYAERSSCSKTQILKFLLNGRRKTHCACTYLTNIPILLIGDSFVFSFFGAASPFLPLIAALSARGFSSDPSKSTGTRVRVCRFAHAGQEPFLPGEIIRTGPPIGESSQANPAHPQRFIRRRAQTFVNILEPPINGKALPTKTERGGR
jgi:hypothetical protein